MSEGYTGRKDGARRCPLHVDAARNEAIVMFMAGHETTANSLAWTWYLLDSHPRVREKLQEELDRVLGDRPPRWRMSASSATPAPSLKRPCASTHPFRFLPGNQAG